jgi:hypothetical protein
MAMRNKEELNQARRPMGKEERAKPSSNGDKKQEKGEPSKKADEKGRRTKPSKNREEKKSQIKQEWRWKVKEL